MCISRTHVPICKYSLKKNTLFSEKHAGFSLLDKICELHVYPVQKNTSLDFNQTCQKLKID